MTVMNNLFFGSPPALDVLDAGPKASVVYNVDRPKNQIAALIS